MQIKQITESTPLQTDDRRVLQEHFLHNFTVDELKDCLSSEIESSVILGLFDGETLLSFLLLSKFDPRDDDRVPKGKLWLERVFTKKEHRLKGYAQKLILHAEQLTKQQFKQSELWLDTTKAAGLYENKLGYTYQFSLPWKDLTTKFYMKKL